MALDFMKPLLIFCVVFFGNAGYVLLMLCRPFNRFFYIYMIYLRHYAGFYITIVLTFSSGLLVIFTRPLIFWFHNLMFCFLLRRNVGARWCFIQRRVSLLSFKDHVSYRYWLHLLVLLFNCNGILSFVLCFLGLKI